jgi:hypothetical protein
VVLADAKYKASGALEALLSRVYNAYKAMPSPTGSSVWNTALLIGSAASPAAPGTT